MNININVFTGIQAHIPLWGVLALGVMGFAVGFKFRPRINPMLLILSGSVFASFYVLATIAPDMGIYRDRYFFSLFPLVSIGIIALGAWLVSVTDRRVAYGLVGVMAVALIHSSLVTESVYLFQDNRDFDRLINDHHVIFVTEEPFRIHEFASRYDQFTDVFPLHARDHEGVSYPDRILDYFGIFPIEHVRLVLVVDKAFPQIIGSEALQATFTARGYGLELIEPTAKTTYDVYRIVLLDT